MHVWSDRGRRAASALAALSLIAASVTVVGVAGVADAPPAGAAGEDWTKMTTAATPAPADQFFGISCASAATCAAVGATSGEGGPEGTVIETLTGSSWVLAPSVNPSTISNLYGVSCATPTNCVAVGQYRVNTTPFDTRTLIETWTGGSWAQQTSPNIDVDPTLTDLNSLQGVSCPTTSFCVAVGGTQSPFQGTFAGDTLIVTGADATWTAATSPGTGILNGVSCVDASNCVAVGQAAGVGAYTVLSGGSWSAIQTIAGMPALLSVDCLTATQCVAAGNDRIATLSGGSWTSIDPDGTGFLRSVSCASESHCAAVGDGPRALVFDGGSWSLSSIENPAGMALFGVSCPDGTVCFAAGRQSGRTLALKYAAAGPAPLVVSVATDEPDADTNDVICDTRADGNAAENSRQCTLRAAIEEANARGGTQTITFAIPGTTPTISPTTALPDVEGTVTLDATTQSGGWVVLSGASAVGEIEGLRLTGTGSTVKGFVVNGFDATVVGTVAGVVLGGGGGHVLTQSRIGTDLNGTAAVGNDTGIHITGPDVTVGQLTGGGAQCTGGCVLVAGNKRGVVVAAARVTIVGSFLGSNAGGTAALPSLIQVMVVAEGIDATIGGSAGTTGRAPGNVIVGTSPIQIAAPNAVVAGNLVGVLPSGQASPQDGNAIRINPDAANTRIGGPTAAERNVVGGARSDTIAAVGIDVRANDVVVEGNHVGIGADGATAVPNDFGIAVGNANLVVQVTGAVVRGNVVSGNRQSGIADHGVETAITNNRIGTNAAGTAAVPNRIGVVSESSVVGGPGGVTPGGCADPCNLVSGNTEYGASGNLQGNFIGTNVTGTAAVPNGTGVRVTTGDVVGAASTTALDGCDEECNLVSGNTRFGVATASLLGQQFGTSVGDSSIIAGNVIGQSVTGAPLGNGGAGLGIVSPGVQVTGNVVASNSGPGVLVARTASGPPNGVTIQENRIVDNVGIPIDLAKTNSFTGDGPTPNHANGHDDSYANHLPSKPSGAVAVLVSDGVDMDLYVGGQLNRPNDDLTDDYRFDFYGNVGPCPSSKPRLDRYLGHQEQQQLTSERYQWFAVIDDAQGSTSVSGTVTNDDGSTSEAAGCWPVLLGQQLTQPAVDGSTEVEVPGAEEFEIGHFVEIGTGTLHPELRKIVGKGSLILDRALEFDHEVGEIVTRITAPTDPPVVTGVTPSGATGAKVAFAGVPEGSGGAETTQYVAECTSSGKPKKTVMKPASVTSITVTGMTKGKSYSCKVRAKNVVGNGPLSGGKSIKVGIPGVPASVKNVKGSAKGSIKVTWGAAPKNGAAVTGYKVTCAATGSTKSANAKASSRNVTIKGLTRTKTYTCKVSAKNKYGSGAVKSAASGTKPK